jgi:hypothetical protein
MGLHSFNGSLVKGKSGITLYKQGFFDDSVLILKVDGESTNYL